MRSVFNFLLSAVLISPCAFPTVCGSDDGDSIVIRNGKTISEFTAAGWQQRNVQPANRCSDSEFVRRIHLDVVGRIPTITERDNFLNDGRADKRHHLIQLLTSSEDYAQHFADTFDTLLMGRTTSDKYSQRFNSQWRSWLTRVFRENRAWNEVVGEILLARPENNDDRGVVWFLYERNNKHQDIAEAVAPAFFGIRIECAQCHDHMVASEIEQRHYWGLVAFFNRSNNVKTKNGPRVSETAIGGFSEFANLEGDSTPNLLTFFRAKTIAEPRPAKDEKQEEKDDSYIPAKLDGDPRVPKFSRRERFVTNVVSDHPLIARAFVNRIWAMLMGRGIVHPFDEMDSTHPPSHPELLDWLAKDFRDSGFNIRRLVQSILHADVYHLQSRRSDGHDDPATFAWYPERPLTAEQYSRSLQLAVRGEFQNDHPLTEKFRQRLPDVMPDQNVTEITDALFLTNNSALNQFIAQQSDATSLISRALKLPDNQSRAELLVLSVFGREPEVNETDAISDFLGNDSAKLNSRLQQTIWSLVTSAEFRFNH